jgi:hypothetical protein
MIGTSTTAPPRQIQYVSTDIDIALNDTKTVKSVTLPNTRNIVFLSMDLTTPPIPGTFVYNPPAGTIEPVGTDTLSVTFTPTNTTDYTTATATVQLVVEPPDNPIETPTIQWPTPASITYGTPLSSVQLDAVATAGARPTPVSPLRVSCRYFQLLPTVPAICCRALTVTGIHIPTSS